MSWEPSKLFSRRAARSLLWQNGSASALSSASSSVNDDPFVTAQTSTAPGSFEPKVVRER